MSTIASLNVVLSANSAGFAAGLNKGRGALSSFVGSIGIARSALAGFGGLLAAGFTVSGIMKAWEEQEAAVAKLESVLRSTGGAAGMTSGQMQQLASDLQGTTKFADEVTVNAQAILATFTQIKGDVFKDAIVSAQDLSSVLGQDLQSSVLQIGKALNDPVKGITALGRAGVSFTASQKEMIKSAVAAGDVVGAQRMIIAELRKEFGGAAEAAGGTMGGRITQLKNSLGELGELIGQTVDPMIRRVAGGMKDLATWIGSSGAGMIKLARSLLTAVAAIVAARIAIAAYAAATKAAAAVQAFLLALSGPKGWVQVAIGVAAAAGAVAAMNALLSDTETKAKTAAAAVSGMPKIKTTAALGGGDGAFPDLAKEQAEYANRAQQLWGETRTAAENYSIAINEIAVLHQAGLINAQTYQRAMAKAADESDELGKKTREFRAELEKQIVTMGMSAQQAELYALRMAGLQGAERIRLEGLIRQTEAMERQKKVADELVALADQANKLAMGDRDFALSKMADLGATMEQIAQAAFLLDEIERLEEQKKDKPDLSIPDAPASLSRTIASGSQRASSQAMSKGIDKVAAEAPKQTGFLRDISRKLDKDPMPIRVFDFN